MSAYLRALTYVLPEHTVSNDDLGRENADWDMPRIASKVGITSRHIAAADETSADLAYAAGRKLIDGAGIDPASIDAVLFCTQTPDYFLPASACVLQHRLGLGTNVAAFDYNQGCSGYVYGLALAKSLIAGDIAKNVLLLTGETYSKLIHPRDRTVRVLFGDGGSASLISADPVGAEIGATTLGTDGSGAQNLIVKAGAFRMPRDQTTGIETTDDIGCVRTPEHLFMDGAAITTFALQRVPPLVRETIAKAGLTEDDIRWYVFHQANAFMNARLRGHMKVPADKAPMYLETVGNTVVNTIPIAMRESAAQFAAGDRVMAVGFGVGYSWGATVLTWGDVALV